MELLFLLICRWNSFLLIQVLYSLWLLFECTVFPTLDHHLQLVPNPRWEAERKNKLEPKMFLRNIHRTQAAVSVYCRHPHNPLAATQWCRLLPSAAYGVRRTPYYALSMGMTQQFFVFCPWWSWPLTLAFKLVRARDQTRLHCKLDANPFIHSGDISVTNKKQQQNKVTDGAKNRTLIILLSWSNK